VTFDGRDHLVDALGGHIRAPGPIRPWPIKVRANSSRRRRWLPRAGPGSMIPDHLGFRNAAPSRRLPDRRLEVGWKMERRPVHGRMVPRVAPVATSAAPRGGRRRSSLREDVISQSEIRDADRAASDGTYPMTPSWAVGA